MENKEILEAEVNGLKDKIQELNNKLIISEQTLANINKPELTQRQLDTVMDAVMNAIENANFEEDNFEWEPGCHGKKIIMEYFSFKGRDDLHYNIQRHIEDEFKIQDNEGNITTTDG